MKRVRIGLLGCGTVGGGLVELLEKNRGLVADRCGLDLELRRVLVRDPGKNRPCARDLITTSPEAVIGDREIDVVVELIGGIEPAGSFLSRAIYSRKNVVTANKALLAAKGGEIFDHARAQRVRVGFEASVCAGIPILRAIAGGLVGNRILNLAGIFNGTSNFILTRMTEDGCGFDEALEEARRRGFAEADPSLDVDGHDAAQKLQLLADLAFGTRLRAGDFPVEGIRRIEAEDIRSAEESGYVVKPLAVAQDIGSALSLRVGPALLPRLHPLAAVRNEFNGLLLRGDAVDEMLFAGKGAGALPTASAVLADIIDVASVEPSVDFPRRTREARGLSTDVESEYYLRVPVRDVPGVIGLITTALGNRGISISHVTARLIPDRPGCGNVKILVHRCRDGAIRKSLCEIARLPVLAGPPVLLPILGKSS